MLTGLYHSHEIHCRRGENRAVLLHTAGRIFQPLISRQVEQGGSYFSQSAARKPLTEAVDQPMRARTASNVDQHKRKKRWQEVGQSWLWISITDTRLSQSVWRTVAALFAIHQWNKWILHRKNAAFIQATTQTKFSCGCEAIDLTSRHKVYAWNLLRFMSKKAHVSHKNAIYSPSCRDFRRNDCLVTSNAIRENYHFFVFHGWKL